MAVVAALATAALLTLSVAPVEADPPGCPDVVSASIQRYALPPGTAGASGLVASPRYPGWGWMVRQHDGPFLYAIRYPGAEPPHELRVIRVVGAVNVDWEDVVYQDGKLYVLESDQPWTRRPERPTRAIYEIPEPDPLGPSWVRATATYRYAYPDGQRYNTETAFGFDGHLVLVPKTTRARLYRFDQPLSTGQVNRPRFVASLAGSETVSMAAVSPDRTTLILANHGVMFTYRLPDPARHLYQFAAQPVRRRQINNGDNVEGGGFFLTGQCKLLLIAKSRSVYRILDNR